MTGTTNSSLVSKSRVVWYCMYCSSRSVPTLKLCVGILVLCKRNDHKMTKLLLDNNITVHSHVCVVLPVRARHKVIPCTLYKINISQQAKSQQQQHSVRKSVPKASCKVHVIHPASHIRLEHQY
jgi:hypothetical protein